MQRKDDPNLVEEVNKAIGVDDGFTSKIKNKNYRDKGLEKQGINNPTDITSNAFIIKLKLIVLTTFII